MPHLAGLISEDSRSPLQRLRRYQLHRIADTAGLTYPAGAAKDDMIPILKGAGITGLEPKFSDITNWVQVTQKDEQGGSHVEVYPNSGTHNTADKSIDYTTEIEKRAKTQEEIEEEEFDKARLEALEEENRQLKLTIATRLEALENRVSEPELPLEDMMPWQLQRIAKNRGIEYKGMKKPQLIKAIRNEDTAERDERRSEEGEGA